MQFCIEILVLLILFSSILFFKSMLIRVMFLIVYFPLVILYIYIQEVPLTGIIELNRRYFSETTLSVAFYSYLIGIFAFLIILWPIRKNEFFFTPLFKINKITHLIIFLLFIISSFSLLQIRTEGGGSATLYLCFSVLLLYLSKGLLNIFTILQILFILFILSMGERVDSILVLVYLLIMNRVNEQNQEKYNKYFLYFGLIGVLVLGIAVGSLRGGNNLNTEVLLSGIYAQQTITDVVYVYLCGVDYYLLNGTHLSLLGNTLFGLIPGPFYGVTSEYYYTVFLQNNYASNPGGGLFFTESIMALGPVGVVIYLSIIASIIRYLFISKKEWSSILFILIFVMFCRIVWYGIIYAYKPVLITLVIFFLLKRIKQIEKI